MPQRAEDRDSRRRPSTPRPRASWESSAARRACRASARARSRRVWCSAISATTSAAKWWSGWYRATSARRWPKRGSIHCSPPRSRWRKVETGTGMTFIARVEVRPEIELRNYKDFSLPDPPVEATADEVKTAIADLRLRHADWKPRLASRGDGRSRQDRAQAGARPGRSGGRRWRGDRRRSPDGRHRGRFAADLGGDFAGRRRPQRRTGFAFHAQGAARTPRRARGGRSAPGCAGRAARRADLRSPSGRAHRADSAGARRRLRRPSREVHHRRRARSRHRAADQPRQARRRHAPARDRDARSVDRTSSDSASRRRRASRGGRTAARLRRESGPPGHRPRRRRARLAAPRRAGQAAGRTPGEGATAARRDLGAGEDRGRRRRVRAGAGVARARPGDSDSRRSASVSTRPVS